MRYLLIISALLFTFRLFASISEPELLEFKKNFEGEYRVLESDGDVRVGGKISVLSTASDVGLEFSTYDTSGALDSNDIRFPIKETTLALKDKKYTVDYIGPKQEHFTAIFQTLSTDYIQVNWTKCNDKGCLLGFLKATKGGAAGEKVDTKGFFKGIQQKYVIDYAGSKPPKEPGKEFLVVDVDSDPTEAVIEAPYCLPDGSFCDLGFNSFPYANTEVYRDSISTTDTLFVILLKENKAIRIYHWEDRSSKVVFRNYQYVAAKKVICLEHIASK